MDVFLGEAERCLVNIEHSLRATVPLDGMLQQAEWLLRDVLLIEELLPQPDGEILRVIVQGLLDAEYVSQSRGRPSIDIPEEQLTLLLNHHFWVADIAHLLNVSPRTIRNRIIQYGLKDAASHSSMPDTQLDEITRSYVYQHTHDGRRSYEGYLRSLGFHIQ